MIQHRNVGFHAPRTLPADRPDHWEQVEALLNEVGLEKRGAVGE